MDWWQALLLGALQGLTEFLPVSSSGHLLLFEKILGLPEHLEVFDLFVHLATAAAILLAFRRDIRRVLTTRRDWIWKLAVASVPVAVLYALMKTVLRVDMSSDLRSLLTVGMAYVTCGAFIAAGDRMRRGERDDPATMDYGRMSWGAAIVIGLAQAVAPLPGVSRSGMTITGGRLAKVDARTAMSFSFLLGFIAIVGGNLLKAGDIAEAFHGGTTVGPVAMTLGFAAAFASGLGAVWILRKVLLSGMFFWFGLYCMLLGAVSIAWHLVTMK